METKEITTTSRLATMLLDENAKRDLLNQYIEQNLKSGIDYGTITIQGKESKPSLLKAGSEKMCSLFHLTPKFRRDDDTWEMLGKKAGVICYVCELLKEDGTVFAEGRGTAMTGIDGDFNINKQVKIAEKRSQTDAVLRGFGLSERFTQDLEDMPQDRPTVLVSPKPASNRIDTLMHDQLTSEFFRLCKQLRWDFRGTIKRCKVAGNISDWRTVTDEQLRGFNAHMKKKIAELEAQPYDHSVQLSSRVEKESAGIKDVMNEDIHEGEVPF